jgi:SPP1 gp7 family putative phage head morphogenesis protein
VPKTANEEILDATVRHQIKLLRFSQGQAQEAVSILNQSDVELEALLRSGLTQEGEARVKALLVDVRRSRTAAAEAVAQNIQKNSDELADSEASWETDMIQGASPLELSFNTVAPATLKAVASSAINGIPLEGWTGKMAVNDVSRIEQQVRLGVVQGETIDQIVGRVRGTKSQGYKDGVVQTTRREAEMIARTSVNHVSTAARQAVWDANADIIRGIRWVATLDGRTSPVCQSRDGHVYPVDSGPRPPAHPNCRSTVAPVLAGEQIVGNRPTVSDKRTRNAREKDFREEAQAEAGDKWKGMSASERNAAVKDRRDAWADANIGQAPSTTNYQTWLQGQSKAFQDDVLGPGKAALFRQGVPLDKFVDEQGKAYSLQELKAATAQDKLNVIQPGVGLKAKSLLQQGMSNQEVVDAIKGEFPDASTSLASVASYKSELNKAGALVQTTEAQVPKAALAKAKNVADVVGTLDSSLTPGMKQALGGQWYTVADDLEGSPGAYGYYEAGKGVTLSGQKLSQIPAEQAKQVAAHELGHLVHKQYDVQLPPAVFDDMRATAKALTPEAKKLYSYYLGHADELTAEVYSQAISPSMLTSQGLNASEFTKAFGAHIDEAKKAMAEAFPSPSAHAKVPLPGGPVVPYEVAGTPTSVGQLAKALLQQGMPDQQVLDAVLTQFPQAKTKMASINSYKSELKKAGSLPNKASGPVVVPKPIAQVNPVPHSPEASIVAKPVAPSAKVLTGPELKQYGVKLMQQGNLDTQALIQQIAKDYPNNASDLNAGKVATWKSLWKKASPSEYAAADKLSKAASGVAKAAGPTKLPALYGQKLGIVSTDTLKNLKGLIAGGASDSQLLDAMKKAFGPTFNASKGGDLLELAKYEVATGKAAAKPYLDSAFKTKPPLPAASKIDMTPSRPASKPSDGLPPPPRYTAAQRAQALRAYGTTDQSALARMNRVQASRGLPELTGEEAAAIRGYTGSTYQRLNRALRSGEYASDANLQAYVDAAQHGMSKMPKYAGLSSRGMSIRPERLEATMATYRPGAVVEESAFISSSTGDQAAFGGNVFMKIQGKTGVDVSSFSYYGNEREVLFMPGTRLRIDKVEQVNGKYVIHATEL